MEPMTTALSTLSLQDREDDHIDHVSRMEQNYRKLAIDFTKLKEENNRLKSDNARWLRLFARVQFENRQLKRQNYGLKKLID